MKKFKYLEHTADAKFQAFGESIEEAFTNAALAMVSLMWVKIYLPSTTFDYILTKID